MRLESTRANPLKNFFKQLKSCHHTAYPACHERLTAGRDRSVFSRRRGDQTRQINQNLDKVRYFYAKQTPKQHILDDKYVEKEMMPYALHGEIHVR